MATGVRFLVAIIIPNSPSFRNLFRSGPLRLPPCPIRPTCPTCPTCPISPPLLRPDSSGPLSSLLYFTLSPHRPFSCLLLPPFSPQRQGYLYFSRILQEFPRFSPHLLCLEYKKVLEIEPTVQKRVSSSQTEENDESE